jgi:hypothetical protein
VLLAVSSCKKEELNPETGSNVEFYLLDNYLTDQFDVKINEETATIRDSALILYDEILSYNPQTYEFVVQAGVTERLKEYSAFAVTVDREVIYTGYFWTSISSRSVEWVVIDLIFSGKNTLRVQLGYPGLLEGFTIPDKRNDSRILDVLKRDNKLVQ